MSFRHYLVRLPLLLLNTLLILGCSAGSVPHSELVCPHCGERSLIPIGYGKPSQETIERAERGELFLGGCVVTENDPAWYCSQCKHKS